MKQTMLLKLVPTPEQHRALLDTMHACNAGANFMAQITFAEKSANKFALQQLVYGEFRFTYHLPAQLTTAGVHVGRVAVRTSGSFRVGKIDGINAKYCVLLQRADGYAYGLL